MNKSDSCPPIAGEPRRRIVLRWRFTNEPDLFVKERDFQLEVDEAATLRAQLVEAQKIASERMIQMVDKQHDLEVAQSQLADMKERAGKLEELAGNAILWINGENKETVQRYMGKLAALTTPSPEGRKD